MEAGRCLVMRVKFACAGDFFFPFAIKKITAPYNRLVAVVDEILMSRNRSTYAIFENAMTSTRSSLRLQEAKGGGKSRYKSGVRSPG